MAGITAAVAVSAWLYYSDSDLRQTEQQRQNADGLASWLGVIASVASVVGVLLALLAAIAGWRTSRSASESATSWRNATDAAYARIEETLPPPAPKLEDEIAEVSGSLAATVGRLHEISAKAQAFEAEVHELVKRADAAKATADLSEEQAQRIGYLLGAQTEQRLREEIEKLTTTHTEQIGQLRKSGTRMALATFVGGVLLGTAGNFLVAVVMT